MNIIFVHGLLGNSDKTWSSQTSDPDSFWPKWLDKDIPEVAIWLVDYPANVSNWRGFSSSIPQHSKTLLELIATKFSINKGQIVFICHSLGGLVVKQILRTADGEKNQNSKALQFLGRVKKVVFLGTPHRGSPLAKIGAKFPIFRATNIVKNMYPNNDYITELDYWYNLYSKDTHLKNRLFIEGKPRKYFGFTLPDWTRDIVSGDSPTSLQDIDRFTVDEDHVSICKPTSKESEVYCLLTSFIKEQTNTTQNVSTYNNLRDKQLEEVVEKENRAESGKIFLDQELDRRLDRLLKCRFFTEFDIIKEVKSLVTSISKDGELFQSSQKKKEITIAWCTRILSFHDSDSAFELLKNINTSSEEVVEVAKAIVLSAQGDLSTAISTLCKFNSPVAYGAAFICTLNSEGLDKAIKWLNDAKLSFVDLDNDSNCLYIARCLNDELWEKAFEVAKGVADSDLSQSPSLMYSVANAFLFQTIPVEFRKNALSMGAPYFTTVFPVGGDSEGFELRHRAGVLYQNLLSFASKYDLPELEKIVDDRWLWIRLLDPNEKETALDELRQCLMNSDKYIRRLGWGLEFEIIDFQWAEKEVNRLTALSGGMSIDAAIARAILAHFIKNPRDALKYLSTHKQQLQMHIEWEYLATMKIEVLINTGELASAEVELEEAIQKGISQQAINYFNNLLNEKGGGENYALQSATNQQISSLGLVELHSKVHSFEVGNDWKNVSKFGRELLDRTKDLSDAKRLVKSLYFSEEYDEALQILEDYPALYEHDQNLKVLKINILSDSGRIIEAHSELKKLPQNYNSPEVRNLRIYLAIAIGDWDSLQGFVEKEWESRANRTPIELLKAAHIAIQIGASRGKELIQLAAEKGSQNPKILAKCTDLVIFAGWDDSINISEWIQQAAKLSGEDGPVGFMPINLVVENIKSWRRQENTTLQLLDKGDVPNFISSQQLNQSLFSFYLMPALKNLSQQDVRKRIPIYAFSGARKHLEVKPEIIALDISALMTLEFLDLLNVCFKNFKTTIIPHGTLCWLFEEKAKFRLHQPILVKNARELIQIISDGKIRVFEGRKFISENLVNEVGISLATFIDEALTAEKLNSKQKWVVCSRPIFKPNSLMEEEADLSSYEHFMCSSVAIINLLARKGIITNQEKQRALSTLSIHEASCQKEPEISDESTLLLDDICVSQLQDLDLLSKIHSTGAKAYILKSREDEAKNLIADSNMVDEVLNKVKSLSLNLYEGLKSGRVKLGKLSRKGQENDLQHVESSPITDLFQTLPDVDAIVVDDRYINQYPEMSYNKDSKPLLSTIDLIDILLQKNAISAGQRHELLTRLRRANFAMIPVTAEDLNTIILNCNVKNGVLEETAEIKSIRESIERLRMSNTLQLPKEQVWLSKVSMAAFVCLKNQWTDGLDETKATARSDWLLRFTDPKAWIHRDAEVANHLGERYCAWLWLLSTLSISQQQAVSKTYWDWLDTRILFPIQEGEPKIYKDFLSWIKKEYFDIRIKNEEKNYKGKDCPQISHSDLKFGIALLPPRIRKSLLEDQYFAETLGIPTTTFIKLREDGPEFDQKHLFKGLQKVISSSKEESIISDVNNRKWQVMVQYYDDRLKLEIVSDEKRWELPDWSGLAKETHIRSKWLERITDGVLLEDPDFQEWKKKVDSRPLSPEDLMALETQIKHTPIGNFRKARDQLLTGNARLVEFLPKEDNYFYQLIGPWESCLSAELHIEKVSGPFINKLLKWDFFWGFINSLLICASGRISDLILIDDYNSEQLTTIYKWIENNGDPLSKITAIEVALKNIDKFPSLQPYIQKFIQDIIDDDPNDLNGALSLLRSIFVFVYSEFSRRKILEGTKPFYRRQAAFAQSSLIFRAIDDSKTDYKDLGNWLNDPRFRIRFFLQGLVDIRVEPRWLPNFALSNQLQAEFIGRIIIAVNKHSENINLESLKRLVIDKESLLNKVADKISTWMIPGPIEGELRSNPIQIPDDILNEIESDLETKFLEPNSFSKIINLALIYEVPTYLAKKITDALKKEKYAIENIDDKNSLEIVSDLAFVSANTRTPDLAEEIRILARVFRRKGIVLPPEKELEVALISAASYEELDKWASFAGDWITEIAAHISDKEAAILFIQLLDHLVHIESTLALYCEPVRSSLCSFID